MNQKQYLVIFVLLLVVNLPFISALEISQVRATNIEPTSATIRWETDQPSNSFVNYGTSKESLQTIGDASAVQNHLLNLTALQPSTSYVYGVRSENVTNDNEGNLFTFTTPGPDITAPIITAQIPAFLQGTRLSFSGKSEAGAQVRLFINDAEVGSVALPLPAGEIISTIPETEFSFSDLLLRQNEWNTVRLEATDRVGNVGSLESRVFADITKPLITIADLPAFSDKTEVTLKATFSENVSYELSVGEQNTVSGVGTSVEQKASLQEGENTITLAVHDQAGWEASATVKITADTQPPQVTAEIDRGREYYEGRAKSSIHGTTELGAELFLFVYRPILGTDLHPTFDQVWAKATADEKGEFVFEDVEFDHEPLNLIRLQPKEVPSGLIDTTIFNTQQIAGQQEQTRYVFILAKDKGGKGNLWRDTVTLHTCTSSSFDFTIREITQFHAPFRLNPQLMDDGRENIQAVFNLTYRGSGVAKLDIGTGAEIEPAFRITSVDFEKACVPGSEKDNKLKLGCQLLPSSRPRMLDNGVKTAWYVNYNLQSSKELSEQKEDFWNEFKKRQIVFPLKVKVNFQNRQADGSYTETKTSSMCTDLGYYIDIPIDSKDMLPDFLVEKGLPAIDYTIEKIDLVLPYIETGIKIAGVGCISSFMGRMAVRWARLFTGKMEAFASNTAGAVLSEDKQCPFDQSGLFLEGTINNWKANWEAIQKNPTTALRTKDGTPIKSVEELEKLKMEEQCPKTAAMWKAEAVLDKAYKWTCDRVFCRAVPAGWTATKEKDQVDTVILKQSQCAAASKGLPLIEVKNCQEQVKQGGVLQRSSLAETLIAAGDFTCYRLNDRLYTIDPADRDTYAGKNLVKMKLVTQLGPSLQEAFNDPSIGTIFAYQPIGSDQYLVGQDTNCENACKNPRKPGYTADVKKGLSYNSNAKIFTPGPGETEFTSGPAGCYAEVKDKVGNTILHDASGQPLKGDKTYSAGYTRDCFVDPQSQDGLTAFRDLQPDEKTGLLQCVCTAEDKAVRRYGVAREALKEEGSIKEDWDYQQAEVYKADQRHGTYYPEWRYYGGRDFSSAFGADYLLDYLKGPQDKEVHQVNPNTQFLGAYQTLCLSRIRAHLVTLKAILQGLRNCIEEAKVTGLHDAGTCKTLFTQHVCGLLYKVIAYFFTKCSPYSAGDPEEGVLGGVGYAFQVGFSSIDEAMSSSINDIKADYGNAKLNEYFAEGSQGFAQSLCMAAFGYDWPLGMDFILDSAYAVPGKSTVLVIPATRELSTYNPKTGTAVYNYEVGAQILPGCKIRSYDVSLSCVGPEDMDKPGVQCGTQGCDCAHLRGQSPFESERVKLLDGGIGFDLEPNGFFSVPIPSPQKIDAQYRYDHVLVQLNVDQYEDPTKCFDEGYRDGRFFYPIVDVSSPAAGVCQVDIQTGRYTCPQIAGLFGGATGSYLEDPFISCYDDKTDSYVGCDTPNLFTLNDEIKVKVHVYNDGKGQCLKMSSSGVSSFGVPTVESYKLPENLPGPYGPVLNLGKVTEGLLKGTESNLQLASPSQGDCSTRPDPVDDEQQAPAGVTSVGFSYRRDESGNYLVTVPAGVNVEESDKYTIDSTSRELKKKDGSGLAAQELSLVTFTINGYRVRNMIGSPQAPSGQCTYRFISNLNPYGTASQGYYPLQRSLSVRAQLFEQDLSGQCFDVKTPVRAGGSFGRGDYSTSIVIQKESAVQQLESRMHQSFLETNYNGVIAQANQIVNRKQRDLEEVIALFYYVAALIAQGQEGWATLYGSQVCNAVATFKYGYPEEPVLSGYGPEVLSSGEYQKINAYFTEIAGKASCVAPAQVR